MNIISPQFLPAFQMAEKHSSSDEPSFSIDDSLKNLSKNTYFNKSVDAISLVSLISLFSSAILETKRTPISESFIKPISSFANYANKTFQMINSIKNITSLYPRKDYLNTLGHASDLILPFIFSMKNFYLSRGVSLAMYVGAHAINIMNEKESFENISEYKEHLTEGIKKIRKNFFTDPKNFISRVLNHKHAMIGVISSFLCTLGVTLWKPLEMIMPKESAKAVATGLRDLGGFAQSIEAMKPGHILSGRIFFGLSGYSQFLGALSNLLGETLLKTHKSAMDPLSFGFSSLGRWLYRISNDRGEAGFKNKAFSLSQLQKESIKPIPLNHRYEAINKKVLEKELAQ
jgi:hypothetical protein